MRSEIIKDLTEKRPELRRVSGVYRIVNRINLKSYVGASGDLEARRAAHALGKTRGKIRHDVTEFGVENFAFEVLELCAVSALDRLERFHIFELDSIEGGYNTVLPINSRRLRTGPGLRLSWSTLRAVVVK